MSATLFVGLGLFTGLFVWYAYWIRGFTGVLITVPLLLWLVLMALEVLDHECTVE